MYRKPSKNAHGIMELKCLKHHLLGQFKEEPNDMKKI